MKVRRFSPAMVRTAHARALAGLLSTAAFLPIADCGGGDDN